MLARNKVRRVSFIVLVAALVLSILCTNVFAVGYVDVIHQDTVGNSFGGTTNDVKLFQSFTASDFTKTYKVMLKLRKLNGSTQSDVKVELYKMTGGYPSGSALAYWYISASSVGSNWTINTATLKYDAFISGEKYAIVLGQASPRYDRYEWAVGGTGRNYESGAFNGNSWVMQSGTTDFWMKLQTNKPEDIIDLSHTGTYGNGFGNTLDEIKRFQTFIVSDPDYSYISGIDLKLRKFNGSSQSDVIVDLYETTYNLPSGSPIASAYIPANEIGNDWTIVNAPLKFALTPNKKYAVVLSQRVLKSARYEWAKLEIDKSVELGKWNGSSWVNESGLGDGWMKVWLDNYISVKDKSNFSTSGYGFGNVNDEVLRYQAFTFPDFSSSLVNYYNVKSIDIKVRKIEGDSQSDLVAYLYKRDYDTGLPTGSYLAVATVPASTIGSEWTVVNVPLSCPNLRSTSKYAIVLGQKSIQTARYEWAVDGNARHGGFGKFYLSVLPAWIDESGLGTAFYRVHYSPSCVISDLSESSTQGYTFGDISNEVKRYETFNMGSYTAISGVELKIRKYNGTAQSDVVVELYEVNNNIPIGTPLARAIVPAFTVGAEWTVVDAPLNCSYLVAGRKYAVVLSQRTPSSSKYEWAAGKQDTLQNFGKGSENNYWTDESTLSNAWLKVY